LSLIKWENSINNLDVKCESINCLEQDPIKKINKLLNEKINKYWNDLKMNNEYFVQQIEDLKKAIPKQIEPPVYPKQRKLIKKEFETKKEFLQRVKFEEDKFNQEIKNNNNDYLNRVKNRNKVVKNIKMYTEKLKSEQQNSFEKHKLTVLKKRQLLEDKFIEFKLQNFRLIFLDVMGYPYFKWNHYDADSGILYYDILSSKSNYSLKLLSEIPVNIAKRIKTNRIKINMDVNFIIAEKNIKYMNSQISIGDYFFNSKVSHEKPTSFEISAMLAYKKLDYLSENKFETIELSKINALLDKQTELELAYPISINKSMEQEDFIQEFSTSFNLDNIPKNTKALLLPLDELTRSDSNRSIIIYNTIQSLISKNFMLVTQSQFEKALDLAFDELEFEECTEDQCIQYIQEYLQVENVFELKITEDNNDVQITVSLIDLDRKYVENYYCSNCVLKKLADKSKILLKKLINNKY